MPASPCRHRMTRPRIPGPRTLERLGAAAQHRSMAASPSRAAAAAAGSLALQWLGRTYGSTAAERRAQMSGDEVVSRPQILATHAVTIAAPPDAVWPWLTQVGWHRGGWVHATVGRCAAVPRQLAQHPADPRPPSGLARWGLHSRRCAEDRVRGRRAGRPAPRAAAPGVLDSPSTLLAAKGPGSSSLDVELPVHARRGWTGHPAGVPVAGQVGSVVAHRRRTPIHRPADFIMSSAMLRGLRQRAVGSAAASRRAARQSPGRGGQRLVSTAVLEQADNPDPQCPGPNPSSRDPTRERQEDEAT
jgi:hypothetical protein